VLNAGSSYAAISIPVTVSQSAASSLTNTASVSGGGETNTTNSSASDPTTILSSSDLRISKVGPSTVITPGSSFNYTITVNNDGASDAQNIIVTDPLPAGVTFVSNAGDCTTAFPCSLGTVPAGSSKTITATYAVPASTPATSVTNIASVTSDTPDPNTDNNAATAVTSLGAPISDLSILKTNGVNAVIPGTPTTYTITVSNAGPTAAIGARVQDSVPTELLNATWTCVASGSSSCGTASGSGDIDTTANVEVSAANTVVYSLTGTVAPDATGNLINTASLTAPAGTVDPSSNVSSDTDNLTPSADLSITKTGSSTFTPGTNEVYTITVSNAGPSNASDVSVTDPTPPGLSFISSTGACLTAFPCDLGIIAPNTSKTITVTYAVPANFSSTTLSNTASVQSPTNDSDVNNNTATQTANRSSSSDLSLLKTVSTTNPVLGQNITYNLKLSNAGISDASTVTVLEQLPTGLEFVSSNPSVGGYDDATGIWSVPNIAAGTSQNLSIVAKVISLGSITNTASITASGSSDPDPTNNSSSVTIGGIAPDLGIAKSHVGDFTRGANGTYTIAVTNLGSSASSAPVTVTDVLPVGLTPTSASGTGWTCSLVGQTATCTRSDVLNINSSYSDINLAVNVALSANASLTNTAEVSGGGDQNTTNNIANDPTTINSSSDLSMAKTVDKTNANLGDTVNFTIKLTNNGPSRAQNIVIAEQLPAGLSLISSDTAQGTYTGGVWSIANLDPSVATLTIAARIVSEGVITNTASISSSGTPDPIPGNNTSSVTVTTTAPDLSIAKSHVGNLERGGTGIYTIDVKNLGTGATIAPVSISDTLPAGMTPTAASGDGWTCNVNAQNVTCTRSDALNSGSSYPSVLVSVDVEQNAPDALTNTASVSGGGDPITGNNTVSDPTNIVNSSDLSMVKSAPVNATPGLPVTYSIRVTNNGPSDAKDVVVNDATPTSLVFVTNTGDCLTAFPCSFASIPAGQTKVITATYTVPANYAGANPISNTASVTSSTPDPKPENSSATAFVPLSGSADLQVTKLAPASVVPGTNASFTITVTNVGPSIARAVKLEDATPVGLTFVSNAGDCTTAFPCDLGDLPVGAIRTITATYAVPATYRTPDPIINVATVTSSTTDPNPNNSSATASSSIAAPIADLSVLKSDGATVAVPGKPIQYTITASNAGPSAALGARVQDTIPAQILNPSWTCVANPGSSCGTATSGTGNLDAVVDINSGSQVVFTLKGTVSPDATGILVNAASVTPPAGTSDPSSANNTDTDQLVPESDLSIVKTGASSITPGTNAVYTIKVSNAGPSNASNVVVSDPTPTGLQFIASSGDCTTAFPCNLGTLKPTETKTITATYIVPADFNGSSIKNTASIASLTNDPNPNNNSSSVTTPSTGSADLSLSKSVDNAKALPGDSVQYAITLQNLGPSVAFGVFVRERIPAGLSLQSVNASLGDYDRLTGLWRVASINPNSSATLTVNAIVTASGPINNTAEVIASQTPDPDSTPGDFVGDDVSSINLGAPVANLSIAKTNNAQVSVPGATVSYTITVKNAGPDPANGALVSDIMPNSITNPSWTCTASTGSSCAAAGIGSINQSVDLASGGTTTFSITGTISSATTGLLTNTARVAPPSGVNDPDPSNNTASDTDSLNPQADIALSKTGPATAIRNQNITYKLEVKNNGASDARDVTVTDVLPDGLTFFSSSTPQGSCNYAAPKLTCSLGTVVNGSSVIVTVVAKATGIGAVTNTASATASTPDPEVSNNTSSVTTTIGILSDLAITKTHQGVFVVDTVGTYNLNVKNVGTASDEGPFTITDLLPTGLTYDSSDGADWTCKLLPTLNAAGQVVECVHAGPLAANASLPELKLKVKVGQAAFPSVTNIASVISPIGDINPSNNTASDPTGVTAPVLAIEKTASSTQVEIGDPLGFTIKVRNNGSVPVFDLEVTDNLPLGLQYKPNSSKVDGVVNEPSVTNNPNNTQTLKYTIPGNLEPGTTRTIQLVTIATPLLPDGQVVNTASASAKAGPLSVVVASNTATAGVKTSKGVFANKPVILGRVYIDHNDNNSFETGIDQPLAGARVYLSDGRYAITDNLGRYNITDLEANGVYALRLDPITVPYQPKPEPDDEGQPGNRKVRVPGGGISIEDFPLYPNRASIVKARATTVTRGPVQIVKSLVQGGAGYAITMTITLTAPVQNLSITDPLPTGATRGTVNLTSSNGASLISMLENDTFKISGILEAGTYQLVYPIFSALPPENVVTDPSISFEEVIR
jgi:uncharacterized repeat protein (TIGR01451 family)